MKLTLNEITREPDAEIVKNRVAVEAVEQGLSSARIEVLIEFAEEDAREGGIDQSFSPDDVRPDGTAIYE